MSNKCKYCLSSSLRHVEHSDDMKIVLCSECWAVMEEETHQANNPQIRVTLSPGAVMPTRGSEGAAGYDLYALEDTTINCFQFIPVNTGVSIEIPAGHYGRVAPRSGLSVKHGVMVGAGVIDSDYRGEIKVALATLNGVYEFKKGDRIAQLIIERIATPELVQVDSLDDTDRGEGGFGSTGK